MKIDEKKEMQAEIDRLRYERDELFKSYTNARKQTAKEFAQILLSDEYIAYNDEAIVKEVAKLFDVEMNKQ